MAERIVKPPWDVKEEPPKRLSTVPREVRDVLYRRAEYSCELCGGGMALGGFHPHHRKLRSRGGDDSPANLLLLHSSCHARVHGHPKWSETNGFMVPGREDPATFAVCYRLSAWRLLDDTGSLVDAETGSVA